MTSNGKLKKTDRSQVKRVHLRGSYDREVADTILDSGLMCHVGYIIDGAPYVTPTCYWRDGDRVLLARLVGEPHVADGGPGPVPVSFTVSHLDGLVMARSGFHHSVNKSFGNAVWRGQSSRGRRREVAGP